MDKSVSEVITGFNPSQRFFFFSNKLFQNKKNDVKFIRLQRCARIAIFRVYNIYHYDRPLVDNSLESQNVSGLTICLVTFQG